MLLRLFAVTILIATPLVARAHGAAPPATTVRLFTTTQVLRELFAESERVSYRKLVLTLEQREALAKRLGYTPRKPEYIVFVAFKGSQLDGYAIVDDERGQVEPITFAVKVSPGAVVQLVEVMAHREAHGRELTEARFRQQFVGKTAREELRVGSDITIDPDASGAARALAAGVRRALILIKELALKQDAAGEKAPPPTPE